MYDFQYQKYISFLGGGGGGEGKCRCHSGMCFPCTCYMYLPEWASGYEEVMYYVAP